MENLKIILLVTILITQILIVIFPFLGKISDNRHNSPKRFTKLGYGLVLCCLVSLVASIMMIKISQDEEKDNKTELENALAERDSINQSKINFANKNLYDAFAKYGLKYDIAEKRISKLVKDSSRVNIINGANPFLYIETIEPKIKDKSIEFKIDVASKMATSYNVNVALDLIQLDSLTNQYSYLQKNFTLLAPNSEIAEGKSLVSSPSLSNPSKNIKYYIFNFHGEYEKSDGTKIKLKKFYMVDMSTKPPMFGEPGTPIIPDLQKFMSQK